jgi:hypothetical protein
MMMAGQNPMLQRRAKRVRYKQLSSDVPVTLPACVTENKANGAHVGSSPTGAMGGLKDLEVPQDSCNAPASALAT